MTLVDPAAAQRVSLGGAHRARDRFAPRRVTQLALFAAAVLVASWGVTAPAGAVTPRRRREDGDNAASTRASTPGNARLRGGTTPIAPDRLRASRPTRVRFAASGAVDVVAAPPRLSLPRAQMAARRRARPRTVRRRGARRRRRASTRVGPVPPGRPDSSPSFAALEPRPRALGVVCRVVNSTTGPQMSRVLMARSRARREAARVVPVAFDDRTEVGRE